MGEMEGVGCDDGVIGHEDDGVDTHALRVII